MFCVIVILRFGIWCSATMAVTSLLKDAIGNTFVELCSAYCSPVSRLSVRYASALTAGRGAGAGAVADMGTDVEASGATTWFRSRARGSISVGMKGYGTRRSGVTGVGKFLVPSF